jgi:hypothetical protein
MRALRWSVPGEIPASAADPRLAVADLWVHSCTYENGACHLTYSFIWLHAIAILTPRHPHTRAAAGAECAGRRQSPYTVITTLTLLIESLDRVSFEISALKSAASSPAMVKLFSSGPL